MISGEIPQAVRASYVWQCTVEAVCGHVTAKMVIQMIKTFPGTNLESREYFYVSGGIKSRYPNKNTSCNRSIPIVQSASY